MRTAVGIWARRELARRWKALVVLGLLAGMVGGLALAAVAGARRSETAYQRYREATGRSDAIVFTTLLGIFDADYGPVRALPEVEEAGEFTLTPVQLEGIPDSGALAPNDDRLYRTIDRPLLVAGRLPAPDRTDEMLVNSKAAQEFNLEVGSQMTIVSATKLETSAAMDGPSVRATVVGIGDSNIDLGFMDGGPSWIPSGAFLNTHPEIPRAGNLVVRLRPGTDVAEFGRRAAQAMGLPKVPVRNLNADTRRITHGTDLERTALLLFAAAAGLAGLVLVGQAVGRTVYAMAEPAPALQAIGFTRKALMAGLLLPLCLTAASGASIAVATAIALSPWFPVGLAGRLEPDPGVHADWLVVLPGAAVVALATLAGCSISAARATSALRRPSALGAGLSLVPAVRRVAPMPAVIGAGMALEKGNGDRALPVRPALASGIAAVLGVVGAFGLLHGIDDALTSPMRSGQFWDADVSSYDGVPMAEILETLKAEADVADITALRLTDVEFNGMAVPLYAIDPVQGDRSFTLLSGRPPAGDQEVVIGPATARALRRGIGQTIQAGGEHARELKVVGIGLLPQTPHFSFDQGAWMSVKGFQEVAPAPEEEGGREETALVGFAPGVSVDDAVTRIGAKLPDADIERRALPQDVTNLRNVRTLPKALAGFLVFLGVGALAHVLATAVRRRSHDLAVLRALGFRPMQLAACVAWQALTVSVVALVFGIPLGIAAGRWSWRWVADSTPLLYIPPIAAAVVLVTIPAALLLANLIAVLPASRAARLRPAEVLRTE